MGRILIEKGRIVNRGQSFVGYIVVDGATIARVGEGQYMEPFDGQRIDAQGMLVMPGAIDDQVHFRQPGLTHKGDIASESRAAAAGGVTSFMDMPNTNPTTTTMQALEQKIEIASQNSLVNFAFFFGATNDNLKQVQQLDEHMVPGLKLFMGSSTGNMLVDDDSALRAIFDTSPVLVAAHCEDEATIKASMQLCRSTYGDGATAAIHPIVRSAEACYRSSARAVELADRYGTRFHLLHLSTARELSLFESKPITEKRITNEVCVHHLWFSQDDYRHKGNLIKWNPSIKSSADRDALRDGLLRGRVDIVATDHAPHTLEEKSRGYWDAPSGGPMIQHSLCAMLEMFTPQVVVQKMSHNPALCFMIKDRGFLEQGMKADIAIVAQEQQNITTDKLFYKCGWSPLEGTTLAHTVVYTIVSGRVVWEKGQINDSSRGSLLHFH